MGNRQSAPANPRFTSASIAFTPRELDDLKSLFSSLAVQLQSNGKFIAPSVFQAFFGLRGPLGDRMFNLATQGRKDNKLTFEDVVITKGTYEKGTNDETEEFIYPLSDVTNDEILSRSDLESVLVTMFDHIFYLKGSEPESISHCYMLDSFLNAATFSKDHKGCNDKSMSFEDFKSWCTLVPSVKKFLSSLPVPPDPDEYAWHIEGALSQEEMEEWKLLYHSSLNGLSFNTFLANVLNTDGPTVLIIKDREGYIYGGYAFQPWERHCNFYGDMKSFLSRLCPKASIFKPTGANSNLQWCAVNFSSGTIPNGVGFGGRVNHFGLFLSAGFDQGHTFSCTTFNSPCLSKTSKICPEVIESWGVARKGIEQEKRDVVKGMVLERTGICSTWLGLQMQVSNLECFTTLHSFLGSL